MIKNKWILKIISLALLLIFSGCDAILDPPSLIVSNANIPKAKPVYVTVTISGGESDGFTLSPGESKVVELTNDAFGDGVYVVAASSAESIEELEETREELSGLLWSSNLDDFDYFAKSMVSVQEWIDVAKNGGSGGAKCSTSIPVDMDATVLIRHFASGEIEISC